MSSSLPTTPDLHTDDGGGRERERERLHINYIPVGRGQEGLDVKTSPQAGRLCFSAPGPFSHGRVRGGGNERERNTNEHIRIGTTTTTAAPPPVGLWATVSVGDNYKL